jgi:hypothetical protein
MKIFGQSADYSEILQRVFYCSIVTGIVCTTLLAKASPAVQQFIDSITTEADIGHVKSVKVLYVLIPGVIAMVSHMIKLHDRISDLLKIRFFFDMRFFLYPLCQGVGVPLTEERKANLRKSRDASMYATVYKYAGFKNPVIDEHLVRTAADNWGWFWALVESSFLLLVSLVILVFLQKWTYVTGFLLALLGELALMFVLWLACIRSAKPQVEAILSEPQRMDEIKEYFYSL